jgi:predicted hydrocarbon binding protein
MKKQDDLPCNSDKKLYYYPSRMGRVLLLAMEEILGHAGVNAVLNLADLPAYIDCSPDNQNFKLPFMDISRIQAGLESAYGPRAGHGLALRIGRACFKYGLIEFAPELGFSDLEFRLLPLQTKLKTSIETFAGLFNAYTDQKVRLEIDQKTIFWHIERCPLCWERKSKAACCHLAVGLLQEALFWVSGGKYFEVEEQQCIACGDSTCTIKIDRFPRGGG